MYSACIKCEKLGSICKGPKLEDIELSEAIKWMEARRKYLGWTISELSSRSRVPVGTISRVFSEKDGDYKFKTIAPLWRALLLSDGNEIPCADPDGSIHQKLTERVRHLEKELAYMKAMSADSNEEHSRVVTYLKSQVRNYRTALIVTALLLVAFLLGIIGVLVYDITHPVIGYFGW